MKLVCIQTCSDFNKNYICEKGKKYEWYYTENSVELNSVKIVFKYNMALFQKENFLTEAEYREFQINSILD